MRTILHILENIAILLIVLAVSACVNNEFVEPQKGVKRERYIPVSFDVAGITIIGMDTKAGEQQPLTDYEKRIDKGVLIQFDENGAVLKKYELTAADIANPDFKVRVYVPTTGILKCVFAANVSFADMGLDGNNTITYEQLNTIAKKIISYDDVKVDATNRMLMSGSMDVDADTERLSFTLKPNVAKLKFSISNSGNEQTNHISEVYSVQVRNIHDRILYAHHAADKISVFKSDNELTRTDYPINQFTPAIGPNGSSFEGEWYIPHNMGGAYQTSVSPDFATYVEVDCKRTIDGKRVVFKIPLNPDERSYNVEGGKYYSVIMNLLTDGSETEFIPFPKSIDYESSNCYLINPYTSGIETLFSFPIDKINEYWHSADITTSGTGGLQSDTKWRAEVIWQDMPAQIIQFYNSNGQYVGDTFAGTGFERIYFKFTNNVGHSSFSDVRNHGNIVIGLRRQMPDGTYERKYQWSWHLWITNYNPNSAKTPDPKWQTTYPGHVWIVDGGEVHRYSDPLNTTDGVWKNDYAESYIMDRSIGGIGNYREAGNRFQVGGLFYQYGRKDPFPSYVPVYNINGARIYSFLEGLHTITDRNASNRNVGAVVLPKRTTYLSSLEDAIFYPYAFFPCPSWEGGDWLFENPYFVTNWNYPANERDMAHKSLFDPCPLGWKVCRAGAWLIFSNIFEGPNLENAFKRTNEFPDGQYFLVHEADISQMNVKDPVNYAGFGTGESRGWYFYMADRGKGPTAYYAANGYRADYDGGIDTEDITAWSIDSGLNGGGSDKKEWAYHLDAYDKNMYLPDVASRSYALPVRCVRE